MNQSQSVSNPGSLDRPRPKWFGRIWSPLIWVVLAVGLIGAVPRLAAWQKYTQFFGDQGRDSLIFADMRNHALPAAQRWPHYGPQAGGTYQLPPLYYYAAAPFALVTKDPRGSSFFNLLAGILTAPLLALLVYRLLTDLPDRRRLFAAGLAGLWYALLVWDVWNETMSWNPGALTAVTLAVLLITDALLEKPQRQTVAYWARWIGYGLLIALGISLHSTALFLLPPLAIGTVAIYLYSRRDWRGPLAALASFIASLTPYWLYESRHHWNNTQLMWHTITSGSTIPHSLPERIEHAFGAYLDLGPQAYFLDEKIGAVFALILFISAIAFMFLRFRGNRRLMGALVAVFALFLFASSNYWGTYYLHYKRMVMFIPAVTVAGAVVYLWNGVRERLIALGLIVGVILSLAQNGVVFTSYLDTKYSDASLMTPQDMVKAIVQNVPAGSVLCVGFNLRDQYQYVATELIPPERQPIFFLSKTENVVAGTNQIGCPSGSYYVKQLFQAAENGIGQESDRNNLASPAKLIATSSRYYVYQVN